MNSALVCRRAVFPSTIPVFTFNAAYSDSRAVAIIFKSVALGSTRRQWEDRVQPIQRLDRRLFIHAEHGRVLRRVQIEPDDIGCFAFKLWVVASHVAFQPVRPQFGLRQNALHGGFAHAQFLGQFAARPMRATVGGFLLRSPDHSSLHRRCRPARLASLMAPL